MAHGRSFSRGSARAPRRLTSWELGPGGDDAAFDVQLVAATSNIIFGSGITPVIPHLTVTRLRGLFKYSLRSADAAGSGFSGAVGIGIVSADAFGVGVTAVPKPFADAQWPGWLWHHFFHTTAPIGALSASNDQSVGETSVVIDSKAMRKLRLNEVLFAVAELNEVTSASVLVALVSRVLVKLP